MQNKANFRPFRPENSDFTKKQTQFKPNTNPIQANSDPIKAKTNPIQTQSKPICILTSVPRHFFIDRRSKKAKMSKELQIDSISEQEN